MNKNYMDHMHYSDTFTKELKKVIDNFLSSDGKKYGQDDEKEYMIKAAILEAILKLIYEK